MGFLVVDDLLVIFAIASSRVTEKTDIVGTDTCIRNCIIQHFLTNFIPGEVSEHVNFVEFLFREGISMTGGSSLATTKFTKELLHLSSAKRLFRVLGPQMLLGLGRPAMVQDAFV